MSDYWEVTLYLRDRRDILRAQGSEEDLALAADLDAAMLLLSARNGERQEAREKFQKWQQSLPQCRTALDRLNELSAQIEKTDNAALDARNTVAIAENRLDTVLAAKPRAEAYPTQAELRKHEELVATFRNALEMAKASCSLAVGASRDLHANLLTAQKELGALQLSERMLRPRTEQQPAWSIMHPASAV